MASETSAARKKAKGAFMVGNVAATAGVNDQDGLNLYGINRHEQHHDQGCLDIFI